ncbi:MAG: monovalent cation/H+ antiporter complex subunit F [Hydrogenophaga sp.]|jgi:multicomponent Na+:H+ antiporter subunit F|uniref:monovalent cation/H+ antiporter complex subunit F n=1 Tax=unclassified Hydrogenophaga TaxID=2610897 RepID=UPI000A2E6327|nr:monovalent cation/H+ antiporter complex subunit F [Hydrogenophaga sp. IBVHS1]MDP3251422.1 monovalent cation/H+ antiporter complex subunit F [Hydrogenophaga sp.]OSZ75615.1 cation:proton antiporter [Hydrogenophaga sp. IBVHS1]
MNLPIWVLAITALLLLVAMLLAGVRIVRGPHAADRVVALDMLSLLGVAAAALAAVVAESPAFVDIALGVALIGFLATVAFAAFIERGSIREEDSP